MRGGWSPSPQAVETAPKWPKATKSACADSPNPGMRGGWLLLPTLGPRGGWESLKKDLVALGHLGANLFACGAGWRAARPSTFG
jgi:hypothetical protein